jgi:hypothetical protein
MVRLLTIPLFLFLMMFSIVWTAIAVIVMARSLRSTSWPRAVGTVLAAEARRIVSRTTTSGQPVDSVTYEPYITYAYSVGGRQYEHDTFAAAVASTSREPAAAEAIVGRYPVGHQVTVFYDPARPDDAVLVPVGSRGNWFFLVFGCVLFAASIAGLLGRW